MTSTTQPAPAKGSARWLEDDPVTDEAWLRITSITKAGPVVHEYQVERVGGREYRLWRLDPKTFHLISHKVYLSQNYPTCDCEDAKRRTCKHVMGLRAALDALPF